MLLHIPGDGSRATAIAIRRDDYAALASAPDGESTGKIKQANGLAVDQQRRRLVAQGFTDQTALEQRSRDAGRNAEVATMRHFPRGADRAPRRGHHGGVLPNAQVVAPITVCVNEDTRDSFSGAEFHQGYQQLSAAQAVAFARATPRAPPTPG